jgi:hypothetical protein
LPSEGKGQKFESSRVRQAEDPPHCLGLDGFDLQGLLDPMAVLLGDRAS